MSKLFRAVTTEQYNQAREIASRFNEDCVGHQLHVAYVAAIMNIELLVRHTTLTIEDVVNSVKTLSEVHTRGGDIGYIQAAKPSKDN